MMSLWPILLIFLSVVVGTISVYSLLADLWLRDRARLSQRVDEEFLKQQRQRARNTSPFRDLDRLVELASADEQRPTWRQRLSVFLEQAGLTRTPTDLYWVTGLAVLAGGGGAGLTFGLWTIPLGVIFGLIAPVWSVALLRQQRLARLTAQLPEALDCMARILRAGQTLTQALQVVVHDFEQPLAGEFAYCHEQQKLGLAPPVSYQNLARRVDLFELRVFALAMTVQEQTGGNVADLLDRLANGIRERRRSQLRLLALTAESRLQARVLLALPSVVFVILWICKRSYIQPMLEHPRILLVTLLAQVIGALWIRSIARSVG